MALNLRVPSTPTLVIPKHKQISKLYSSSSKTLAQSEKTETGLTDQESPLSFSGSSSSARSQLDLLDQLTSTSSSPSSDGNESEGVLGGSWKRTIRDQLAQLVGDREGDFSVALGQRNLKRMSDKFLTTSQKRNIKRQAYMNQVSKRNDSSFFATIGAFVLLPPIAILAIAILTGYVQLFP